MLTILLLLLPELNHPEEERGQDLNHTRGQEPEHPRMRVRAVPSHRVGAGKQEQEPIMPVHPLQQDQLPL